jgi:hypothetical protein
MFGGNLLASIWREVDPTAATATKPISALIPMSLNLPSSLDLGSSEIGAVGMARFIIAAMLAVALCPGSAMDQVGAVGGGPILRRLA